MTELTNMDENVYTTSLIDYRSSRRWLTTALLGLALFFIPPSLPAQTGPAQPTVYQTLFTNQTTTGATAVVRNIGQVTHTVTVLYSNQSGKVCTTTATDNIGFEESPDGTNFFRFGPILSQSGPVTIGPATGFFEGRIVAHGAYPYVRLNVRSFDTTDCQLTAVYTGSINQIDEDNYIRTSTLQQITVKPAVAGDNTLLAALASGRAVLYQLTLWNVTAQNLVIKCSGVAGNTVGTINLTAFGTATGVVLPYTGKPYLNCTVDNTALVINLQNNTEVDVEALAQYE